MVIKAMDKEAADRAETDNSNHHLCKLLRIMGVRIKAGAIPMVEITNMVDACKMVPAIKDRTIKGTDKMVTMVTIADQTEMTIVKIRTTLVSDPAGAALVGMVDPVADQVADPVVDLPEVVDLPQVADLLVADLLVDLLMGRVADLVETLEDPEGQMDQGGRDA